ncbi:MAG: hypothetical protein JNN01_08245 [Opitutaceae bacterium]|nr:hypothetical protein [Opitutaceae bacterium]
MWRGPQAVLERGRGAGLVKAGTNVGSD